MHDQADLLERWAAENDVWKPAAITSTTRLAAAPTVITPPAGITTPVALRVDPPYVKLSVRRPEDLVGMNFDDTDNLLDDRLLAKGQFLVIAGPAGIGKSRFVLQLAASLILKKEFLKLEVKNESGPCLILQTENVNRRLTQDMAKLKAAYPADEWKKINENLLIHTLEQNHDYLLGLGVPINIQRLKELINEKQPSVIVFDPLYTFGVGDLNTDADMSETCRKIQEVGHENNPHRALIVLHHALTGKTGAIKAMGFDKSSYGRNSKLLYAWTRAQINLAPGSPDDNNKIVVACGKNNNGKLFKPFAAKLNTETMIYEVDYAFDLTKWEGVVRGKGGREQLVTTEKVAEILGDQVLTKAKLAKAVREEVSCGKTTAYAAIDAAEGNTIRRNDDKKYSAFPKE